MSRATSHFVDIVDSRTGSVLERRVRRSDASATIALARSEGRRYIKMVPHGATRNPSQRAAFPSAWTTKADSSALGALGFRDSSWANDQLPSYANAAAKLKVFVGPDDLDSYWADSGAWEKRYYVYATDDDGEVQNWAPLLEARTLATVVRFLRPRVRVASSRGNPGPFDGAEVIHAYTRKQALADGTLVDVTEWGSDKKGFIGGFTAPVAMTQALWSAVSRVTKGSGQDVRGRAHDVLWMASLAVRAAQRRGMFRDGGGSADFDVILSVGRKKKQRLRVHLGGGDSGEPVVTIGFPEDF